LGLEFTRQYLADGWRVLACSRQDSEQLVELANAYPTLSRHALDVTDHQRVDALAAELAGTAVDVLLLSAGTMGNVDFAHQGLAVGGFGGSDFADWQRVSQVNTVAVMKMAEAFVNHVQQSEQRKLVAISSMVASMGENSAGGLYAYRASKAGLNAIMRSMSVDLADRNIIALPIHPGWASTEMGGAQAPVSPTQSVTGVRNVIAKLTPADSGRFLCYDGTEMPW
jgi:NAD(P)-dependent dehydrogenase (short-subunit alcohol dehydrogenase family)